MNVLGNRIKKERENLGLSREDLAKKLGVSYSAIAMYEQGNREPNNELILEMCKIFDCTADYLIGNSQYKNEFDYISKNTDLVNNSYEYYNELADNYPNFNLEYVLSYMLQLHHNKQDFNAFLNNQLSIFPEDFKDKAKTVILYLFNIAINTPGNDFLDQKLISSTTSSSYYMCPVYGQISAGQPNWAEQNIEGRLPIDPDLMDIINPEEYFFLRVNGESMNNVIKNGGFALIHKQDMVEDGEIAVVLVNGYDATLKRFTKKGDVVVLEPDSNDNSFKTQIYDKTTPIKILGKYVGKMEINK